MKNKKKYLSIWACFIFCLLFVQITWADENTWQIKSVPINNSSFLSIKQGTEDLLVVCNSQMYFVISKYNRGLINTSRTTGYYNKAYQITIDNNQPIVLSDGMVITESSMVWHLGGVLYNKIKGEGKATGTISEYKTLFQQMLDAKKSITVEATDADNQKHSVTFGVKGLRDGLLEMNQRCGSDFQYYSGIPLQGA